MRPLGNVLITGGASGCRAATVEAVLNGGGRPLVLDRAEQYKPPPDAKLNRPEDVAATPVYALRQPPGCQLREMVVCWSEESSWP